MKSKIIIEIETKDIKKTYNTPNEEEWTDDNDITEDV